jgi:Fe2+ or Zn2+ uptake regulation protein
MPNPYNPRLDREALHRYLWDRSSHSHRIKIHQGRLAEALNVTRGTVVRVLKEMGEAGRIRKVESLPDNIGIYKIADPDDFAAPDQTPKPRRIQWS